MIDLDGELPSIAAGDAAAFGRWLAGAERPLRESLRPFATRLDVEAVLQEGLLRVWQVAPRAAPDGRPNVLLRLGVRVCRNLALSELRRRREELPGDDAPEPEVEPAPPDPLLRERIAACLAKLPGKPAQALRARLEAAGGRPDESLAASLGMRLNTFLQNFTRARKLLEACLAKAGVEVG